jgi:hypothetical protein
MIERTTIRDFASATREDQRWLDENLPDWNNRKHDLVPSNPMACRLVRAMPSGHPVLITASFFTMFAERTNIKSMVFPCVHAFCTTLELFRLSNNVTAEHTNQRKLLRSFLMGCDGLDMSNEDDKSTYRVARRLAVAKGYFQGPTAGVFPVSMNLGIGYAECLYLCHRLGFPKFQTLIQTFLGLAKWQDSNPLEPDFACPGIPGSENGIIKPTPCCRDDPNDDEESACFVTMIGARLTDHPL